MSEVRGCGDAGYLNEACVADVSPFPIPPLSPSGSLKCQVNQPHPVSYEEALTLFPKLNPYLDPTSRNNRRMVAANYGLFKAATFPCFVKSDAVNSYVAASCEHPAEGAHSDALYASTNRNGLGTELSKFSDEPKYAPLTDRLLKHAYECVAQSTPLAKGKIPNRSAMIKTFWEDCEEHKEKSPGGISLKRTIEEHCLEIGVEIVEQEAERCLDHLLAMKYFDTAFTVCAKLDRNGLKKFARNGGRSIQKMCFIYNRCVRAMAEPRLTHWYMEHGYKFGFSAGTALGSNRQWAILRGLLGASCFDGSGWDRQLYMGAFELAHELDFHNVLGYPAGVGANIARISSRAVGFDALGHMFRSHNKNPSGAFLTLYSNTRTVQLLHVMSCIRAHEKCGLKVISSAAMNGDDLTVKTNDECSTAVCDAVYEITSEWGTCMTSETAPPEATTFCSAFHLPYETDGQVGVVPLLMPRRLLAMWEIKDSSNDPTNVGAKTEGVGVLLAMHLTREARKVLDAHATEWASSEQEFRNEMKRVLKISETDIDALVVKAEDYLSDQRGKRLKRTRVVVDSQGARIEWEP